MVCLLREFPVLGEDVVKRKTFILVTNTRERVKVVGRGIDRLRKKLTSFTCHQEYQ